ncbi:hypothetical protein CEE37_05955 [candidate division LCP-89 bacterium B3_LCP]|uniref:Uncharacterized protein n=1 Tax=candidate division LCP-89 bacterium B3_LCP TaxID=2012998 RepID=A0A532V2I9_UNCL8|nr:MAG: hypothetical protein CEE37_05955 [candidate division LCP-89 bacterium B3_LCP]
MSIIAIIGPPAIGKTLLCSRISAYLDLALIHESEELPSRIIDNINRDLNFLETQVWFHNQMVHNIENALNIVQGGESVIMDTYWGSLEIYTISECLDEFHLKILLELSAYNRRFLPQPDLIIGLTCDEQKLASFFEVRGANYEKSPKAFRRALKLKDEHERFYLENPDIKVISTDNYDFNKDEDIIAFVNRAGIIADR